MFIPCGADGEPLEKPQIGQFYEGDKTYLKRCEQFQKAKEKVIFEGFEARFYQDNKSTVIYIKSKRVLIHYGYNNKVEFDYKTIEDLTHLNIKAKY